jgi:CheY-like chemotaxis protein
VYYFENGMQLMEKLQTLVPDLVLLDINMPIKNGIECLIEIRENKINTKVIVLTAFAMEEDKQRFFSLGSDGYIPKPYVKSKFFSVLDSVLKKK